MTPPKPTPSMREALERIANPIQYMRAAAAREGKELDGQMAIVLSRDPEYLKQIARDALALSSPEGTVAVKRELLERLARLKPDESPADHQGKFTLVPAAAYLELRSLLQQDKT